jgi:ZIP family zinc transporter
MPGALTAGIWGSVGGSSLLLGCALGLWSGASRRTIGLVMAFGAGALIASVAFELVADAYAAGGLPTAAMGLVVGGLAFSLADGLVSRFGRHRKRSQGQQSDAAATSLVIGALMDGIPESVAIGVALLHGPVNHAMVVAVFLSNIPEAMSAAAGMRKAGHSAGFILVLWATVVAMSAFAAAAGHALLGDASGAALGGIQAFAAGAVLTMLASTMMPEAYEEGGAAVGLVTTLGFLAAFALSTTQR